MQRSNERWGLPHFRHRYLVFLLLLLGVSCATPESRISGVVEQLCRSRIEGDYTTYLDCLGGPLLERELTQPAWKTAFSDTVSRYKKNGMLFVDIYIRQLRIDPASRQATIFFIEKWSQGTRTFTASRTWLLEMVDGSWRVIRF